MAMWKNLILWSITILSAWFLLDTTNLGKSTTQSQTANPALTAGVFGSGGIFSKIFSGQSIVETKSNRVAEFDWSNFMFKVLPRKVRNVGAKPGPSGPGTNC